MLQWIYTFVLRLPDFKGKGRLLRMIRSGLAPYRCRVESNVEMELDLFEWTQIYLAQHGTTEPVTMKFIRQRLKEGNTFVDVGAHVGFVTLQARVAVGPKGRVIAIEPQPYNGQRILRNWEINEFRNLDLYVAAAGENDGNVRLPQQSITDKSRLSLALPMPDALDLFYRVPLLSLQTVMKESQIDRIDLLKIDVEGYELSVMKGLGNRIGDVQCIVFEALDDGSSNQKVLRVCDFLEENGFAILKIDETPWDRKWPIPDGNLVGIRKSKG